MLTEQQLIERKTGIGGSDAAAVCGVSKWRTSLDIYKEKVLEENEIPDNKYMEWGRRLEPILIEKTKEQLKKEILTPKGTFRSEKNPFMIAHIDGLTEDAVIECKTANAFTSKDWGEEYTDQIPDEYIIQCAHYAHVMNKKRTYLAVLIGGNDYKIYQYDRKEAFENNMIKKEKNFWDNHVVKEVPPSIHEIETPVIKDDEFINGDEEDGKLIEEINNIKLQVQSLSNKEKEVKNKLITKLNNYPEMYLYGEKAISYKYRNTLRFDITKFKTAQPLMYKKYLKKSRNKFFNIHT